MLQTCGSFLGLQTNWLNFLIDLPSCLSFAENGIANLSLQGFNEPSSQIMVTNEKTNVTSTTATNKNDTTWNYKYHHTARKQSTRNIYFSQRLINHKFSLHTLRKPLRKNSMFVWASHKRKLSNVPTPTKENFQKHICSSTENLCF